MKRGYTGKLLEKDMLGSPEKSLPEERVKKLLEKYAKADRLKEFYDKRFQRPEMSFWSLIENVKLRQPKKRTQFVKDLLNTIKERKYFDQEVQYFTAVDTLSDALDGVDFFLWIEKQGYIFCDLTADPEKPEHKQLVIQMSFDDADIYLCKEDKDKKKTIIDNITDQIFMKPAINKEGEIIRDENDEDVLVPKDKEELLQRPAGKKRYML